MLELRVGGKYLSRSELLVEIVSSEENAGRTFFIDPNGFRYFPDGNLADIEATSEMMDRRRGSFIFLEQNSLVSEIKPGDPRWESFVTHIDPAKGINDYKYPENPKPLRVQVGKSYHTDKGTLVKIVAQVFLDVLNTEEGKNCYSAFKGDNNTLYDLEGRQLFRVIGLTDFSKPDDLSFEYGATPPHKNIKDIPFDYAEAIKAIQGYLVIYHPDGFVTITPTKSALVS